MHIIPCVIKVLILPFFSCFLYSSATVLLHTSLGTDIQKGNLWHIQGAIKSHQTIYQYKAAKHQKNSLFVLCVLCGWSVKPYYGRRIKDAPGSCVHEAQEECSWVGLSTAVTKKLTWSQHQENLRVSFDLDKQLSTAEKISCCVSLSRLIKSVNVSLS